MLINLAVITTIALLLSWAFERFRLPGLLGMILTGVLLGPCGLDIIGTDLMAISAELRTAALIVILIRAGLGINRETLNRIGIPALKMSCIPGILEGLVVLLASRLLLDLPLAQAGMLAFIVAAVSPAVVVPQMLDLKEKGFGRHKEVPTLVLAGASLDDVFAITLFGVFLGMGKGEHQNLLVSFLKIPFSIVLGVGLGATIGYLLVRFFRRYTMRDTRKVLVFMAAAILFHQLENYLAIASLVGIMAIGFVILEQHDDLAKRLAAKFNKIWVFAEILLFVLIGAQVQVGVVLGAGLVGLLLIALGLAGRSLGVWLSLAGSELDRKERLFCMIAYTPKATVQAAIGALPLAAGLPHGEVILAIAVLSIIVTAPLGAIGIRMASQRLLER